MTQAVNINAGVIKIPSVSMSISDGSLPLGCSNQASGPGGRVLIMPLDSAATLAVSSSVRNPTALVLVGLPAGWADG